MFENNDYINILILLGVIVALIGITFVLKKFTNFPSLITRKFLHITAIFVAGLSFLLIDNINWLYILGGVIFIGNIGLYKLGLFEEKGVKNPGIVYVPISFSILAFFLNDYREIAATSLWVMAFSDAMAAIVGTYFPIKKIKLGKANKSIGGTIAFFAVTVILLVMISNYFESFQIVLHLLSASELIILVLYFSIMLAAVEALSSKGFDNLAIPILSGIFLVLFKENFQSIDFIQLLLGLILSSLVVWASIKLRFLKNDGVVAAFILGGLVFGFGGVKWTIPILLFYVLSSVLSKFKKESAAEKFEKGSQRDLMQVFANGGIPGLAILFSLFYPSEIWYVVYLISLSVSTADTWATEFGNLKKRKTINILNFKEIEQGESGGISVVGSFGGLVGAILISLSGAFWLENIVLVKFLVIVAMGFSGMLIDSILGASLQRKNTCVICKKQTEKQVHCNHKTEYETGARWLNNDGVNFLSALTAVVIFLFISYQVL